MMKGAVVSLLSCILSAPIWSEVTSSRVFCNSPQYLELGKTGSINCHFSEEYFNFLWYTASDYENGTPTLRYQKPDRSGAGYESGKFDIHPNGSLIILKVMLEHETTFTVAYRRSKKDFFDETNIRVIVLVKAEVPFPVIDQCSNVSNTCYAVINEADIKCSVRDVRPNVTLNFILRTVAGDIDIFNDVEIIPETVGYTSRVTTSEVFSYTPLLALLVCKADSPAGILESNVSMVLSENTDVDISQVKPNSIYLERYKTLKLNCTDKNIGFIVWKKVSTSEYIAHDVLLYFVLIGDGFGEIFSEDVILENNVSLVISSTDIRHEGEYLCIFGDGLNDGLKVYHISVTVPVSPVVTGCNHQHYCVLESDDKGSLTCRVNGIRPQVELEWKTFYDNDAHMILFSNQHMIVKDNGETFDVTLTSNYRVQDKRRDRITLECRVSPSNGILIRLTTKIDLLFVSGNFQPEEQNHMLTTFQILLCVIAVLIIMLLVLLVAIILRKKKLKDKFLRQLRQKYEDLYEAIQPIPYIKNRTFSVDNVFVERDIEFLESRGGVTTGQWTSLQSYQNVFDDQRVKSNRRIIEADHGFGKSTVTLQFAYDWCNFVKTSALKDVEILILLRLRQLGGVTSFSQAIKQFILPKDSRLTESDIKHILQSSQSVVIILDGFDEYPDQNSDTSDIIRIIAKEMFQEFEVVLTTRSSFLPRRYPASTKRIRLNGFDDNAREFYIRKAVVGNDDEKVREVEKDLQTNPIVSALCQVPLLFVFFAHMTFESEKFRSLISVTSCFRYMISCFRSHLKNEMEDENATKYNMLQSSHSSLDKVAFEVLSRGCKKIIWRKDELCKQLGQEFYDQYIRIGILVEEEVIDIADDPLTEHVQYKTEVRFYHKLFCEWYAAHYLSAYIQKNPGVDLSVYLQHLHPFDVQYLYQFSCGLNAYSAEKIIHYLKNIEDPDRTEVLCLCILEYAGKTDDIIDTIRQLCFEGIIISGHDSLILQRSSIQILQIATENNIPIECVHLHNCLQSVELTGSSAVKTTSNLSVFANTLIKRLCVRLYGKEMNDDEASAILEFSTMCPTLRFLGMYGSFPLPSFKLENTLSTLKSRKVTVKYFGAYLEDQIYILNLQTGQWEKDCSEGNGINENSERENSDWHRVQPKPIEIYRHVIRKYREELRSFAKKRRAKSSSDNADEHKDEDDVSTDAFMAELRVPREEVEDLTNQFCQRTVKSNT